MFDTGMGIPGGYADMDITGTGTDGHFHIRRHTRTHIHQTRTRDDGLGNHVTDLFKCYIIDSHKQFAPIELHHHWHRDWHSSCHDCRDMSTQSYNEFGMGNGSGGKQIEPKRVETTHLGHRYAIFFFLRSFSLLTINLHT